MLERGGYAARDVKRGCTWADIVRESNNIWVDGIVGRNLYSSRRESRFIINLLV